MPTLLQVVGDETVPQLVDVAGLREAPAGQLSPFTPVDPSNSIGRAYLRLLVKDEPGVIAAVSETLAEAGVSIESFLQKPMEGAGGVPIVLTRRSLYERNPLRFWQVVSAALLVLLLVSLGLHVH